MQHPAAKDILRQAAKGTTTRCSVEHLGIGIHKSKGLGEFIGLDGQRVRGACLLTQSAVNALAVVHLRVEETTPVGLHAYGILGAGICTRFAA